MQQLRVDSMAVFHNLQVTQYNNEKYLLFNANSSCDMNSNHDYFVELNEQMKQGSVKEKSPMVHSSFNLKETIEIFNGTSFEFSYEFNIVDIDKNQIYKCCPLENCQKRINTRDDGSYECSKCNKSYTNYAVHALMKVRSNPFFSILSTNNDFYYKL